MNRELISVRVKDKNKRRKYRSPRNKNSEHSLLRTLYINQNEKIRIQKYWKACKIDVRKIRTRILITVKYIVSNLII